MSIASPSSACRFPLIAPTSVTHPVVREVYTEIERELGFGIVPNLFQAMAYDPAILRATWDLFRSTVLQGTLPQFFVPMKGHNGTLH